MSSLLSIVQSVPYHIGLSLRFKDKNTQIILANLAFSARNMMWDTRYYNLKIVISEVYASFVLQCTVSGR